MQKTVTYPRHVTGGILPNHRAHPLPASLRLFGADTETVHGNPHTFQAWPGPDSGEGVTLKYVTKETIFPAFWVYLRGRLREGGVNLCYFHNLKFDLVVLLAAHHTAIYEQGGSAEFFVESDAKPLKVKLSEDPYRVVLKVEALYGKVNAITVTEGRHYIDGGGLKFRPTVELKIYDSRAFTQAGLARSLSMFKIPMTKMTKSDEFEANIGKIAYSTPEFEAYAKQDAVVEWHLARRIMDVHAKYKVRPSISLPQFMSRVFRHYYFKPGDQIEFPPQDVVQAAELSYHGGKNGMYADPGVYEDVTEVDINSAYPWAMKELPNFLSGNYAAVKGWEGPEFSGIYKISGWTDPAAVYPLVFDHVFKRVDGHFTDLWTTSYEVERILSASFIRVTKIEGYVWRPGPSTHNPFSDFVDEFYRLKQESSRDDPYYQFYKIALNALYGKLVGMIEEKELLNLEDESDASVKKDYRWDAALGRYVKSVTKNVAGQMYNPFIATLITGKVRALLYDLEVKYEALHSATDSIKTRKKIFEKSGLGGWKEECHGRCWIFRNKLYLHFTKKNPTDHDFSGKERECTLCKKPFYKHLREKGQSLEKVALHAYKGTVENLFNKRRDLLRDGKMDYEFQHVVGLREGMRQKETPADFVMRSEVLNLKRGGTRCLS